MVARLGAALSRWAQRWVPDPFVLAIALTALVLAAGLVSEALTLPVHGAVPEAHATRGFWHLADGWLAGVTNATLLAFALEMALILVTGHALALSPPVQAFIERVARIPGSAAAATVLVALVACASALVHWGLGAITGALLAREIGRHAPARGLRVHYPLLGAAAYAGLAVWHGGLSGSAPLAVAAEGHSASHLVPVIPASETIFSPLNLAITGVLVAVICLVFRALVPRDPDAFVAADATRLAPLPSRAREPGAGPVHWLQESDAVGRVVGGAGLVYIAAALATGRMVIDLDTVVLGFLFLAIALQGSLRCFSDAVADGARGAGAILVQFPFYFGILGIMKAAGLVALISDAMVSVASEASLPVWTFLSAGLVNLVVPSGGGQWVVQHDIVLGAGLETGADPAVLVMAFSYGDAWTNMLQPFWALPLLGIMGLRARDIIGYTAVVMIAMALVVPAMLLALG